MNSSPQAIPAQSALTDEPLTEAEFDILRSAVNLARFEQIRSLDRLRQRLLARWPDSELSIERALHFWSASTRARHPEGPPRYALD